MDGEQGPLGVDTFAMHVNIAASLYGDRGFEEALSQYELAHEIDPRSSIVHNGIGTCLGALGRTDEAIESYERSIELDPENAAAFNNYGDCLNTANNPKKAERKLLRALEIRPEYPEALSNLGNALAAQGRLEDAVEAYRKALAVNPQLWKARKNLGMVLLQLGQFEEGFAEYDWRFMADGLHIRPLTTPVWDGENLDGELLICAEQGLGDEILHLSLMGDLLARGLDVVWEADARLAPLIERSFLGVRALPRAKPTFRPLDPGPSVLAQYPAASLARLFRPDAKSFPGKAYLKACPERREEISNALDLNGKKLVGISWRSKNREVGDLKSTELADWMEILKTPGVRFVSLQYGHDDTSGLRLPGLNVTDDIDGLAALMSLCDAVVTVSNTTAHLAGALGVPTVVMVPGGRAGAAFWCWGREPTAPWYSSVRVIRQADGETWAGPLARAAEDLKQILET